MPILAYCMTDVGFSLKSPTTGVHGATLEGVEAGGVRCLFSSISERELPVGGHAQENALAFHRVLQEVFAQTAVLPFRFPTLLQDKSELVAYIQDHAGEYQSALARLRDAVQMEIRITPRESATKSQQRSNASGAEYLRERLARQRRLQLAAQALQEESASLVRGWRRRESGEALRCFILLDRGRISEFQSALASARVPPNLTVRVSGPWPATEFVKED
jgi:Gas vesicle synthesis protein GvpL/GvpF